MSPLRRRLRHLPAGLAASGMLLVVAVGVGALVSGAAGAAGAAAGVILVAASYTGSSLVIAWADSINPRLVLPVGMLTYVVKFTLIGIGAIAVGGTGWAGVPALACGIAAGVVAWTTAQAWWTWHAKIPYVELD